MASPKTVSEEKTSGGKRIREARKGLDKARFYKLDEALEAIKSRSKTKFDETIDFTIRLGVDPKQSDQMVRGIVGMPSGIGKSLRVAVFAKGPKAQEAIDAGAEFVGADDLAEKIAKGETGFDRCIATPDMMGVVGKLGKVLGPRGLMPNPKLGTVTMNVADAVKAAKSGQVEFRVEKAGIVHAGVGKASFAVDALSKNIKALVEAIAKAKPSGAKGVYLKSAHLTSTMGPSVKLDISSLTA